MKRILCDKEFSIEELCGAGYEFSVYIMQRGKQYEERFCFCGNADEEENEFETGTMTNRNLYKVKLMKSLWYADALHYKQTGRAMTGPVYRHEAMGALPVGHYSLMNLENLNVKEEMSISYDSMLHVYPSEQADYSPLSKTERGALDAVIGKFKDYKASEIVEYMHEERAYKETENGEIIPFCLAGEIRAL